MKDTWFAVGRRWWAHEGVDATGMPWALPFILDAIKDGNGRCTDLALTDARILRAARLDQLIKADGHSIRDAYVAVGILVADDDGWGARNWDKWQRDDVKAKKQKADRERIAEKRGQSRAVSQNVAATNCDAGDGRRESPRVATHTGTSTSTKTEQEQPPKAPRGKTDDPPLAPHVVHPEPQWGGITIPELERLAIECIPVTSRRGKPMSLDGVSSATLVKLVETYGPQAVRDTLLDCGGMDLPVQAAKARMARAKASQASSPHPPPPAVELPKPLDPDEYRARAKAAVAILDAAGL